MNDFTKDELETILYCVDVVSNVENTDEQKLFDKIQSLIDNYCEHEWDETRTLEVDVAECFKCGAREVRE